MLQHPETAPAPRHIAGSVWQQGTITAAVSLSTRLLAPLAGRSRRGRAQHLRTGGFLALLPVEALGEVAYLRFQRFHLRLQGRFALHQARVLGSPVVGFPLEGDIVLLRQHHALLGERGGVLVARWCL
jgi:hypothetical protein